MHRLLFVIYFCISLCMFSNVAKAEGFAITDFSARGTALAGGLVGRADDPSAVAYNPAGITQIPDYQIMVGMTFSMPKGSTTVRSPTTGITSQTNLIDNVYPIPNIYGTLQLNDFMWLGLGLYSRFGLGVEYPSDWPGRFAMIETNLQTVSFNPNLAFKVTDKLSFAVGVELLAASMQMKLAAVSFPSRPSNSQEIDTDDLSYGFNAAAHYVFDEQWRAGFTYRSGVKVKATGTSTFQRQVPAVGFVNTDARINLDLPSVLSLGINYAPTPAWDFEAGIMYTFWSSYKDLDYHLSSPISATMKATKDWSDTWLFNISTEYQALDWLSLRLGYSYETSPVNDTWVDYMVPSGDLHRLSAGVGFNWDAWVLDVGYSYIFARDVNYRKSQSANIQGSGLSGKSGPYHIAGIALSYAF